IENPFYYNFVKNGLRHQISESPPNIYFGKIRKPMTRAKATVRRYQGCLARNLSGILSAMASSTVVQQGDDMLRDTSVEKIILVGASGVGKTWTAYSDPGFPFCICCFPDFGSVRRSARAGFLALEQRLHTPSILVLCETSASMFFTLEQVSLRSSGRARAGTLELERVFCNREYHGTALSESIARQLSLLPIANEWEAEDSNKGKEEEENHVDLQMMIAKSLEKKKVLLILDDEGNKMKEGQIMPKLELLLNLPSVSSYKVLITSTNAPMGSKEEILVKPLSVEESLSLFRDKAWLLRSGYDMLPRSVLIDCCRHGSHFFRDRGSIHYSELIAYWILEGYLGHVDCMEKAYEKGHSVFMELVDCQLLKKLDSASLGLADLYEDCKWEGFERINQADGMIKSVCSTKTLFLNGNRCLEILDSLSGRLIFHIPLLTGYQNFKILDNLLISHYSGCITLTEIKDTSFEQMSCLQHLDLSDSGIICLPELSNLSNLSVLYLKRCTNLKALPPLETLSNLEELNLCGVSSLKETGAGFLVHMSRLQILDLSETQIEQLPSMSNLKSLRQLSIRGCQHLQTVPNLEVLMSLKVLDLSGTAVTHIPSLENFSNLRQLLIRGCSNLKGFMHVEMIDLLGTTVKELPYGISKLTHLECLDLPHTKKIQGAESRNMKSLPEVEDPYQWSMSSFENPHIAISGIQFLQILKKNPSSLETRFHLCVYPTKEKNKNGDTYSYRNDHIFGDILFRTAEFDRFKEQRSLEIHGFDLFPSGVGDVLCNADCVFFYQ
ncbi:hypothetical protein HYC85_025763, partial [Camellia sinensis]